MTPTIMQTTEVWYQRKSFEIHVWLSVLMSIRRKRFFLFIFDVKRNNLGSSTFISFECKLLIITFKIWWSFPRSSKEKETWHGKKCVLVAWLKKFISILMIMFLPFWCYISLFLVNKIFIFINYWCLFCPLDDVQHEKFFV